MPASASATSLPRAARLFGAMTMGVADESAATPPSETSSPNANRDS